MAGGRSTAASHTPSRPLVVRGGGNDANLSTLSLSPVPRTARRRVSTRPTFNGDDTGFDLPEVASDGMDEGEEAEETLVDRMRGWRNDAMAQHLLSTAAFWAGKAFEMTGDPNDAFWLAQIHFLTHQYARAEAILTTLRPSPEVEVPAGMSARAAGKRPQPNGHAVSGPPRTMRRLADVSVACRYLAAQCLIRQSKWTEASELLGETNLFRGEGSSRNGPAVQASDGGIKFEASLCHLRGLIQLHLNDHERAKECFMEALSLDVKCFESFEALIAGNMLGVDEEWSFIQSLAYRQQLPHDAEFVQMMYTVRLNKYKHNDETNLARKRLADEFGLAEDPDVLFGLADNLFAAQRWADCFLVTSLILRAHDGHRPTMPLHLACMYHLPHLRPALFLLAHDLVDRQPDECVAWYAVGLWYLAGRRWDEARRFFGKAVLLDARHGPAWIAFAHTYALEGEHDQAITAYSTAQRHFQGSHLPVLFIGMQHLFLTNWTLATDYLDTAARICPDSDWLVANELGVCCYESNRPEQALVEFEKAIRLSERVQTSALPFARTWVNLGHAYRKLHMWDKAMQAFKRGRQLDPRLAGASLGIGFCYAATGQRQAAIEALHEALAIEPLDPLAAATLKLTLEDASDSLIVAGNPEVARFPGLAEPTAMALDEEVRRLGEEWALEAREAPSNHGDADGLYGQPPQPLEDVSGLSQRFADGTDDGSGSGMIDATML